MIMNVPGVSDMVTRINDELPPEIRLWGYVNIFPLTILSHPYGLLGSSAKFLQCASVSLFLHVLLAYTC